MAYLTATPQEEISTAIQQNAEVTANAVKWVLIIGIVLVLLYFATTKK